MVKYAKVSGVDECRLQGKVIKMISTRKIQVMTLE